MDNFLSSKHILLLCVVFWGFSSVLHGQSGCKVLQPELEGEYEGECKKGIAHGFGTAVGTEMYQGQFKKGLPNGQGRYVYADSSYYIGEFKDGVRHGKGLMYRPGEKPEEVNSSKMGVWEKGEFVNFVITGEYEIVRTRNVTRTQARLVNQDRMRVEIRIQNSPKIEDMRINQSSGSVNITTGVIVIDEPDFPLNVIIQYQSTDILASQNLDVITEMQLITPGNWMVTLSQ